MFKVIDRILDRLVSHLSVEDGPDRTIFYPWGIFGKGVVATTDMQRRNLSRVIKATIVAVLPIAMLPPYLPWPAIAAIMATVLLTSWLVITWLARGLETKPSIISNAERTQGFSARRGIPLMAVMLFVSLLFMLISLAIVHSGNTTAGLLIFGIFSVFFLLYAYLIYQGRKAQGRD